MLLLALLSVLAALAASSLAPGLPRPGPAPAPPAPPRAATPAPAAAAAAAAAPAPGAPLALRACAPQIGGDGTRRGAGNVDNANAAAAGAPPPRGAHGSGHAPQRPQLFAQICGAQALSAAVT